MERNLDRRIEAVVPVQDAAAQARLDQILEVMLADDRRSWQLGADACWRRTEELTGRPGTTDTFASLKALALADGSGLTLAEAASGAAAAGPKRAASIEPWA
jgi:polyphosphate kinase